MEKKKKTTEPVDSKPLHWRARFYNVESLVGLATQGSVRAEGDFFPLPLMDPLLGRDHCSC